MYENIRKKKSSKLELKKDLYVFTNHYLIVFLIKRYHIFKIGISHLLITGILRFTEVFHKCWIITLYLSEICHLTNYVNQQF